MMDMQHHMNLKRIPALAALAFCCGVGLGDARNATAQVASEYRIPLTDYLSKHDLAVSELGNVMSLKGPMEMQWTSGIIGNIRPSYFTITPTSRGVERIDRSLKITYNPIFIQPMNFESCDTGGECHPVSVTASGRSLVFSHEGMSWDVRSPGSPCNNAYACTFTIPAWSLEMRRQGGVNGENGWKSFPGMATLLDQPRGISIFDARTGSEWITLPFKSASGPTAALGAFTKASLTDSGMLNLTYERASLLLDFSTDRLFAISSSGAFVANESLGLAQETPIELTWRELPFVTGAGKVLVASEDIIVWQDRAVTWSARTPLVSKITGTQIELPGTPSSGELNRTLVGTSADILVKDQGRVTHWRYAPISKTFEEIRSEPATSGQNYGLVSGVLSLLDGEKACDPALVSLCNLGATVTDVGLYATASALSGAEIKVSILRQ